MKGQLSSCADAFLYKLLYDMLKNNNNKQAIQEQFSTTVKKENLVQSISIESFTTGCFFVFCAELSLETPECRYALLPKKSAIQS